MGTLTTGVLFRIFAGEDTAYKGVILSEAKNLTYRYETSFLAIVPKGRCTHKPRVKPWVKWTNNNL